MKHFISSLSKSVTVPRGYHVVYGGELSKGDITYYPRNGKFDKPKSHQYGMNVEHFWCVIRKTSRAVRKRVSKYAYVLICDRRCKVSIPTGYRRIYSGKSRGGDMYYSRNDSEFKSVCRKLYGIPISSFYCIVRKDTKR